MATLLHTNPEGQMLAKVACKLCRKRKVKCNRELPRCQPCEKLQQGCVYPQHVQKPGPKLGTSQKNRRTANNHPEKRRKTSESFPNYLESEDDANCEGANSGVSPKSILRPSDMQSISLIIHPSHDSWPPVDKGDHILSTASEIHEEPALTSVSYSLGVAPGLIKKLLKSFVDNYTSFRLFREPFSLAQLQAVTTSTQINALTAAMLSFASKYTISSLSQDPEFQQFGSQLSGLPLVEMATAFTNQAIDECGDEPPPLCVLQALILCTHRLLCKNVRGRAWRSLGLCIRLAYEMNLHLVDASSIGDRSSYEQEPWVIKEEKRRAWWAIWEMDTYASVLRRCPAGIDWKQHKVLLPVDDESWSQGRSKPSCFLGTGFISRCKDLAETGSKSEKAWFIVINSLAKEAQALASPGPGDRLYTSQLATASISGTSNAERYPCESNSIDSPQEIMTKLRTLGNSLQYCMTVLPPSLQYEGQFLDFGEPARNLSTGNSSKLRHRHSSIFGIHLMAGLTKLMIHKYQVFHPDSQGTREPHNFRRYEDLRGKYFPHPSMKSSLQSRLLDPSVQHYFAASDSVLRIINSSSDMRHCYVNPFLSSTVWLAAAVQLVHLEMASEPLEKELVASNYEILNMVHNQFVLRWNMSVTPRDNLITLANRLRNAVAYSANNPILSRDGHHSQRSSIQESSTSNPDNTVELPGEPATTTNHCERQNRTSIPLNPPPRTLHETRGEPEEHWVGNVPPDQLSSNGVPTASKTVIRPNESEYGLCFGQHQPDSWFAEHATSRSVPCTSVELLPGRRMPMNLEQQPASLSDISRLPSTNYCPNFSTGEENDMSNFALDSDITSHFSDYTNLDLSFIMDNIFSDSYSI
ncbi:hypothetical protein BTUL_0378g00010 [Botrytis tulipae]|uniref:Zn(2)-C6 fungal-type domain-containing protein n=1 Tax=Botrytis tulipae TaxID=87230 RepID=A0A4Z1E4R9_9HELO|nr:hypothetical protein BTUL_0378g00010 [Botrytis tulipae]